MRDIHKVIGALSPPIRRDILALIWDRDVPAGEIAAAFSVTKPTISQHLAVLREAGLVSSMAVGTSQRYRACQEALGASTQRSRTRTSGPPPTRSRSEPLPMPTPDRVVASVEADTDQDTTCRAFADPDVYSRWLGVPVSINEGRFSCTLEWGTHVRGRYEVMSPPELIAMRWDFDDGNVPVPGAETSAYLRVRPRGRAHVEVHQIVDTAEQAEFMEAAWTLVLGRLKSGVASASEPGSPVSPRRPRAKRRNSA